MAKKAVLIGINRYKVPGADLRGCVPDVQNMSTMLQTKYGFDASDIQMITDFDATKAAMEAAITGLVAGGRRGDVLLLHYSGHGSHVADDNGDEEDDRDEILCPTDLDWQDTLRDDWLRNVFAGLQDGVNLTVVSDSCHSGTITREIQPPDAPIIERYLPSPDDLKALDDVGRTLSAPRAGLSRAATVGRSADDVVEVPEMAEVLISGCRADQTSADARIEGGYAGALTYHLVQSLMEAPGPLTYRELHEKTLAKLTRGRYEQVPQLEGNKIRLDQPFLSPLE